MNAKTAKAEVAKEGNEVKFAAPRKYAPRVEKTQGKHYDPNWAKCESTFVVGHPPKTATSVMGVIFSLVGAKENKGKTGKEFAAILRAYDFPNRKRSVYLDGLPPVGWAEGYIDGAVQKGYIVMLGADGKPVAKVAAPAAKAGEKAESAASAAK